MDLIPLLEDFIDELLGAHSAYAISDIAALHQASDADAFVRLRVRICDGLLAEGWIPGTAAAERRLEQDRQLLAEDADEIPILDDGNGRPAPLTAPSEGEHRGAASATDELEQMRRALASRAVIEQAKGIAMERYGLSDDVAWSWLVRMSQNRNLKVRVIAEELVDSISSSAHANGADGHTDGSGNGRVRSSMLTPP